MNISYWYNVISIILKGIGKKKLDGGWIDA